MADGLALAGPEFGLISFEFVSSTADRVLPRGVGDGGAALPHESKHLHLNR